MRLDTGMDLSKWFNGILFVGDEGMLLADYKKRFLLPEEKFAKFEAPEPTIAKSAGHHAEWLAACRGEGKTLCNFEYSGSLIEHNLLGTTAFRAGKKPAAIPMRASVMIVSSAMVLDSMGLVRNSIASPSLGICRTR